MSVSLSAPTDSGPACAGCGWVESPGATECRSCGDTMPGAGNGYAPGLPELVAPVSQIGQISQISQIGQINPPATRPKLPVSKPERTSWMGALPLLLFRRRTLGLLALIAAFWQFSTGGPVTHPPGILIKEEPVQGPVPAGQGFWQSGETNIRALASYNIKGRVLHPERYRWDAMADLAPMDLGVGWGVMSDETNATACEFSNSGRYLSWHWSSSDFPADEATRSMTNMHMLPANDRVRDRLLSLRPGQLFQAGGYLVEVMRPGMGPWTSSLTRLDTGNGACEIMWVQSLVLLPGGS